MKIKKLIIEICGLIGIAIGVVLYVYVKSYFDEYTEYSPIITSVLTFLITLLLIVLFYIIIFVVFVFIPSMYINIYYRLTKKRRMEKSIFENEKNCETQLTNETVLDKPKKIVSKNSIHLKNSLSKNWFKIILCICAVSATFFIAIDNRYSTFNIDGKQVYYIDNWTGNVYYVMDWNQVIKVPEN